MRLRVVLTSTPLGLQPTATVVTTLSAAAGADESPRAAMHPTSPVQTMPIRNGTVPLSGRAPAARVLVDLHVSAAERVVTGVVAITEHEPVAVGPMGHDSSLATRLSDV